MIQCFVQKPESTQQPPLVKTVFISFTQVKELITPGKNPAFKTLLK